MRCEGVWERFLARSRRCGCTPVATPPLPVATPRCPGLTCAPAWRVNVNLLTSCSRASLLSLGSCHSVARSEKHLYWASADMGARRGSGRPAALLEMLVHEGPSDDSSSTPSQGE